MKALVTGGTGFVGGAVVRALVANGWAVRVLARRTSQTARLQALGAEIAYGDVLDRASLISALDGCEALFHAAAVSGIWTLDPAAMMRTEVEGTRNALEAALQAGVARVVYTSTYFTIGEKKGQTGHRATPHRGYFVTQYERAKHQAEQVARAFLDRGLPLVMVNPATAYGPGDLKDAGRALVDALNGRLPMIARGQPWTIIYVEDAGRGHVLAAEKGRVGERYLLAQRAIDSPEWIGTACRLAGVPAPRLGPLFATAAFAALADLGARLTRRPPLLSWDGYKLLAHGARVDGAEAAAELALEYTPFEDGLRRAIAWYWEQGLLKRKPAFIAQAGAAH